MTVRLLTAADVDAYRAVRLRALAEHPEAFATTAEEERARPADETAARLEPTEHQATFGTWDGARLVGIATVRRSDRPRLRHRAGVVAMYVAPEARGGGVGGALLERCVGAARGWGVSDLALAVTVGNVAARRLYLDAGFVPYGVEPRALMVDGRPYDVELMNLTLG